MGKKAARKSTTSGEHDPAMDYLEAFDARSQLISASIGLGWQLALMVLVPIFIGVQVDRYFDTSPSFTLTALFLAVAGSIVIITRAFKDINQQQAKLKPFKNKRAKKPAPEDVDD